MAFYLAPPAARACRLDAGTSSPSRCLCVDVRRPQYADIVASTVGLVLDAVLQRLCVREPRLRHTRSEHRPPTLHRVSRCRLVCRRCHWHHYSSILCFGRHRTCQVSDSLSVCQWNSQNDVPECPSFWLALFQELLQVLHVPLPRRFTESIRQRC